MSILISSEQLAERRRIASGALAPLADSLGADLTRAIREMPSIPEQKAMLTREGGRCPACGTALDFDPFSPHAHRCPMCNTVHIGERHDRWWLMSAQLWRAERAVHAAALHAVRDAPALVDFALDTLDAYAYRYDRYPLADNVLGPSRPFFSTYLESIWLLQLCIAADLLDATGAGGDVTGRFRDRVVAPSAGLIRSYDEGGSNRQLWNNAALLAAGRTLGDRALAEHALFSPSGLVAQLGDGLLADGSWYEGENYHLFSHRALWYGVTMAETAGYEIPPDLLGRFQAGFSTPFLTAFPDLTFPARRDSQYGASLRQWRTAESCELGLARQDDERLKRALAALYADDIPRRDTGRWRSTAEAERNEPASALGRADLGWRSLFFARETLPPLRRSAAPSALLEGQGIAVFRRDEGKAYVALDYGHHGGGHGHPDRLNVLLAHGTRRILDDMGTGSYVSPSLHWYRSTLAHNAPLVNGRSQPQVSGTLLAYDERGDAGWVCASAVISREPHVIATRALTVTSRVLVDELRWSASEPVRIELPIHARVRVDDVPDKRDLALPATEDGMPLNIWRDATLDGGDGLEDGFSHVHDARSIAFRGLKTVRLLDEDTGAVAAWVTVSGLSEWWTVSAPGAPGAGEQRFLVMRTHAPRPRVGSDAPQGMMKIVWNWLGSVREVKFCLGHEVIEHRDGSTTDYWWDKDGVHLNETGDDGTTVTKLSGFRDPQPERGHPRHSPPKSEEMLPLSVALGEADYRMSELSWTDAGEPRAHVRMDADDNVLEVRVDVRKAPLYFRAPDAPDPALDNEHPDIHSDGVQLHLWQEGWLEPVAWLAVPELPGSRVRVRQTAGGASAPALAAHWRETPGGYEMLLAIPRASLAPVVAIDVLVNDMSADRQRRRGQLVLSGARGERVYLRGDRQPLESLIRVRLPR